MISLFVEPRTTYTWNDFCNNKPPYSIALDGFVLDHVRREVNGPYANFDHHIHCDRIATRATAEQISLEINIGLFKTFRKNDIPTANVFVNDPDADTCLSWWLLKNHERVEGHAEPTINRLVYCVDKLDALAGMYSIGPSMSRKMAWIFEPYYSARFNNTLSDMDATGYRTIIEAVSARITEYTLNQGQEISCSGGFECIGGGNGWRLVKEYGIGSRSSMLSAGVQAFATLVQQRSDNSFTYSLGRSSVWIPFDLTSLYQHLNDVEASLVTEQNCWGGSNTIGGSPRSTGSRLAPADLEKEINKFSEKGYSETLLRQ